ncbi:ATP-binding protein [Fibrobacterota bacterium]
MNKVLQIKRLIHNRLPSPGEKCIVLLTGARQTGKTTSAKFLYSGLNNYNMDSIEYRHQLMEVPSRQWGTVVGNAVLDEVQKQPELLEKVKYAYDAEEISFSVLLGSAQILLMKSVRETLAGRVLIYELWPLTYTELLNHYHSDAGPPLFAGLADTENVQALLAAQPSSIISPALDVYKETEEYMLKWGGMPGIMSLSEKRKMDWLRSYNLSYLERDLSDLARLNDLMPFRKFHQLSALRSSQLLSYSEIANDAGISVVTARQYFEYLKISYQVFFLAPFSQNLTSTVVKTPKIYWTDIGLWRMLTGQTGKVTGPVFENFVIAEIMKLISALDLKAELTYYRTRSGLEIDALLSTPRGIMGFEIKARERTVPKDASGLRKIGKALGKKWLGGIIVYRGNKIENLGSGIWAVPSYRLLGCVPVSL